MQIRGVNEVFKSEPYYPAADDFGPDNVAFLAEHGFTTVRLGVDMLGLQPEPEQVSEEYLDGIATSVGDIVEGGLDVVLDFHQDGFSPKYNGNGWPDWLAIDDGLENPEDATFPLYYVQNPAMQRAWESFWENREGPGGVGLQDLFAVGVTAVVERFRDEPGVLGYELVNEPFPGADWAPRYSPEGCPTRSSRRSSRSPRRCSASSATPGRAGAVDRAVRDVQLRAGPDLTGGHRAGRPPRRALLRRRPGR